MRSRAGGYSKAKIVCRWLALLMVVVGLEIAQGVCEQQKTMSRAAVEQEYQAAMALADKGDTEGAKRSLLSLRSKQPGVFAIDESLGLLFVSQDKFEEALPFLQAAVREEPASDVAHANLGAALFRLHRNDDAVRELRRAAQLNARNAETQQALGAALLEGNHAREAADAFGRAVELKPDNVDLALSYGSALLAAGDAEAAEKALANVPDKEHSAAAQALLGDIAEKQGRFAEALEHMDRAARLEASEANAWALGVELLRHWTFEAAIAEFQAAVAKYPESLRLRFGLGAAYFGGGRFGDAIPVFAGLLKTDGENATYAHLLGMACNAVSQGAQQQCEDLTAYAKKHPGDAQAATYAASMLLREDAQDAQVEQARKLLSAAVTADPKLPDAQYQLGLLKQSEGDWSGSVAPLERAIALKPQLAQAHYRLALAYWRTGRKQDGQVQMELEKKYAAEQREDLDRRLRQISTFLVDVRD